MLELILQFLTLNKKNISDSDLEQIIFLELDNLGKVYIGDLKLRQSFLDFVKENKSGSGVDFYSYDENNSPNINFYSEKHLSELKEIFNKNISIDINNNSIFVEDLNTLMDNKAKEFIKIKFEIEKLIPNTVFNSNPQSEFCVSKVIFKRTSKDSKLEFDFKIVDFEDEKIINENTFKEVKYVCLKCGSELEEDEDVYGNPYTSCEKCDIHGTAYTPKQREYYLKLLKDRFVIHKGTEHETVKIVELLGVNKHGGLSIEEVNMGVLRGSYLESLIPYDKQTYIELKAKKDLELAEKTYHYLKVKVSEIESEKNGQKS